MCTTASLHHRAPGSAALALLSMALGACVANGPRYHEMMAVAESQQENTRVFLLRPADRWLDYRASPAVVRLNGERIGRLWFDGFFYVDVPPGSLSLEVSARSLVYGVCRLELEAGPGETVYLDVRVRTAHRVAGGAGMIIGGELASAALLGPVTHADDNFPAAEIAVAAIGTEIGVAAGSAAESAGKECGGPFVITAVSEEQAVRRLDGLAWSD